MNVDLAFTSFELEKKELDGRAVVVIDVLRATSTIIKAFESGCAAIIPVATVEEARAEAARHPGFLLAGERGGVPPAGFQMGNSPRDVRPDKVRGKTVVMTTTNGTGALLAARGGAEVFIGSFLNLSALAARLLAAGRDVTIACSGEKNLFCLEDTTCGGALIERLENTGAPVVKSDAAQAAKVLFEHCEGDIYHMLRQCEWGLYLERIGMGRDIRVCAEIDSSVLVPVFREGKIFIDR